MNAMRLEFRISLILRNLGRLLLSGMFASNVQVFEPKRQVYSQMRKILRANTQVFEPFAQVAVKSWAKISKN